MCSPDIQQDIRCNQELHIQWLCSAAPPRPPCVWNMPYGLNAFKQTKVSEAAQQQVEEMVTYRCVRSSRQCSLAQRLRHQCHCMDDMSFRICAGAGHNVAYLVMISKLPAFTKASDRAPVAAPSSSIRES